MPENPGESNTITGDEELIAFCAGHIDDITSGPADLDRLLTHQYWAKRKAGQITQKKSVWRQCIEYLQGLFMKTPAR